jgi:hypothetical protein
VFLRNNVIPVPVRAYLAAAERISEFAKPESAWKMPCAHRLLRLGSLLPYLARAESGNSCHPSPRYTWAPSRPRSNGLVLALRGGLCLWI